MSALMPMPKYHQIYLVLREQLHEGRFDQGLPGELALMRQFGVARVTVRRALEQLAGEGLISREPGRGTRPLHREVGAGAPGRQRAQLSGLLENRIVEYVDHLHEHFVCPVKVRNARYLPPLDPGYSISIRPQSLDEFEFPSGRAWSD